MQAVDPKPFQAHSVALEAAGLAICLARAVPAPLRSISDQVVRAASSVPAEPAVGQRPVAVAEGVTGRAKPDRRGGRAAYGHPLATAGRKRRRREANLSEGQGRSGRDRMQHWRIAYASAREVDSHLRLLAAARAVDGEAVASALVLFDRVRAMTWRLLHPKA